MERRYHRLRRKRCESIFSGIEVVGDGFKSVDTRTKVVGNQSKGQFIEVERVVEQEEKEREINCD